MAELLAVQHFLALSCLAGLVVVVANGAVRGCTHGFRESRTAWVGVAVIACGGTLREAYNWLVTLSGMRQADMLVDALASHEAYLILPSTALVIIGSALVASPWLRSHTNGDWPIAAALGAAVLLLISAGAVIHAR